MKRNFLVFSLFACVVGSTAIAQQDKLMTHFIFDKMSLNPGATANTIPVDGICATSLYRNQWDKVNGAPNSAVLNVEARLERFFPGRVGVSFYHDAIGFTRQNNVLLNYAYPLEINGVGELSVGVGVGIQNIGMDPTWVPPTTLADNTLPTGYGTTQLDANFGLYFKGDAAPFYVGLSSTHLPASTFESNDATPITYDAARHYYLMGGYTYQGLGPGDLEGNVLVRTDMVKFSTDINARYIWQNQAYGGLTFRTSDAVAIMLGAQPFKMMNGDTSPLDHFIVGYSYDVSINKLSSISRGSHEILMKYCYYLPPIPIAKSKHPRWL
jgi:type IX secretion system PorP/SprF family membrane protein